LQGVGDPAGQRGLLLLQFAQDAHHVAVAALQEVAGDRGVGGQLLVQPGAPPPGQREPVAAPQPVEPGQLRLGVVDRDDQRPAVRVVGGGLLQRLLDLGAAALRAAEPAGEAFEFEQVQPAVLAELDVAAAVAAAAVQPLGLGMQAAQQHRDQVLEDRLDLGGLPLHGRHAISKSRHGDGRREEALGMVADRPDDPASRWSGAGVQWLVEPPCLLSRRYRLAAPHAPRPLSRDGLRWLRQALSDHRAP
jgi:hypothetical protein